MYINQKHDKDCLQATISNLLDIPYDTIPEFFLTYSDITDTAKFLAFLDDWLSSIGHFRILFDIQKTEHGEIGIPFYCSKKPLKCIGILEKKGREYQHAVLLQVSMVGDRGQVKILHDPKPNTEYTIDDLFQVELILKNSVQEKALCSCGNLATHHMCNQHYKTTVTEPLEVLASAEKAANKLIGIIAQRQPIRASGEPIIVPADQYQGKPHDFKKE